MTETINLLKQIVAIPSYVDDTHDEVELINFIIDLLKTNQQLKVEEQPVEGKRRNLIVTDGNNPKILLFGHLDTVLPKKQQEKDLQEITEQDGKIYGLGAVDMKSGLAIMLDIAINHHRPGLGYIFSVDEEFDFKGALKLKEINNLHPEYIINLEPTNLKILNGCRGITEFEFEVYGKSAHAGRKKLGINAIEKAIILSQKLESACQKDDPKDMTTSVNLAYIHGGLKSEQDQEIKRMGNIVPNFAKVVIEIRLANKSVTKDFITTTLNQLSEEEKISISTPTFKFYLGSFFTPKEAIIEFEKAIQAHQTPVDYGNPGSTGYFEVQILQEKWGGHAIVFGPSPTEKSHTEDEYVDISSVLTTQEIVENFLSSVLK